MPESRTDIDRNRVPTSSEYALGEAVLLPTRLQFDRPNPTPNSDDVDFYAKWIDGPTDLDVDAIVKRWRSQER